ncbi:MAG TPA: helix-turn-helix domain-containing protein [Phycisphaerae bacterium]|nr:helix-turn-helix domain-containing protein [Phycisphaerae bacterium]
MTKILKEALSEQSLNSVAVATGVQKASLIRFVSGRQSLRLDKADKLAAYFGIECRRLRRRRD